MDFSGSGAFSDSGTLTVQSATAFLDGLRRGTCRPPPVLPGMTLRAK
jgi:hypothetical protein